MPGAPLECLAIPEGVSEIGKLTFAYCTSLRELILPRSLTGIDVKAFCFYYSDDIEHETRHSALRISHVLPEGVSHILCPLSRYKFCPEAPIGQDYVLSCLHLLIPYFSPKTLALLIANQADRRAAKAIREGLNWPDFEIDSPAISENITALLREGEIHAPERAAAFHLDHVDSLDAQHLGAFIGEMHERGYDGELGCLNDSVDVRAKLAGKVFMPAHPVEASLESCAKDVGVQLCEMRQRASLWRRKGLTFGGFRYADGTPLSMEALAFSVLDTWYNDGSPQGRAWLAALDARALQAALMKLAARLVGHDKRYRREMMLLKFCCVHGDDAVVWLLASNCDKFDHHKFNHFMLCSDTHAALAYADRNWLHDYAKRRHTSESALRCKLLDDFGLDARGVRVFRAGADSIAATLLPDAQISLTDLNTGEALASFPRTRKSKTRRAFDIWKAELEYVAATHSAGLRRAFDEGTEWPLEFWRDENFSTPIYALPARGLVWQARPRDGGQPFRFRTDDGWRLCDALGNELKPDEGAVISIAHPVELTREELRIWQRTMAGVIQPIPQLTTPVRQPAPGTLKERYEGLSVTANELIKTPESDGVVTSAEGTYGGTKSVSGGIPFYVDEYLAADDDDADERYEEDESDDEFYAENENELEDYCYEPYEFEVYDTVKSIENRRSYNADILLMDELLDPFQRAREAVRDCELKELSHLVEIELITPENIGELLGIATETKRVEVTAYLLNLAHQWQVEPEEYQL